MERTELLAAVLMVAGLAALPLGAYYYQVSRIVRAMSYGQAVEVVANTFENGGWLPDKIVVRKGEPVRFIILSSDMIHSLVIPELGIDSGTLKPGSVKVIEFTPASAGVFTIYCGIICSPLHSAMKGKLVVVDQ